MILPAHSVESARIRLQRHNFARSKAFLNLNKKMTGFESLSFFVYFEEKSQKIFKNILTSVFCGAKITPLKNLHLYHRNSAKVRLRGARSRHFFLSKRFC